MQIFSWLIEALKVELGLVRIHEVKCEFLAPSVRSETPKVSVIDRTERVCSETRLLSINAKPDVKNLRLVKENLQILSGAFEKTAPVVNDVEFANKPICCVLFNNPKYSQIFLSDFMLLSNRVKIFAIRPISNSISSKSMPILRVARFKPKPMPKDEKFIKALAKLFMKENLTSDFSYVGFYVSVPIESARKVVVIGNELVLELGNKRSDRKDILILKKDQEYKFLIFSIKQLMENL